ncbi:MAG: uroporphyrinogen decarboxylase family protein [Planctomycetia bacterium]|nr:uroporphyrinogen decarboxylase family protein [Planctomycetia bacterium]
MTSRERLEAAFALEQPDRTPVLGGWLAVPEHIMTLTGADEDAYWADPVGVSIKAHEILGVDGLVGVFVPATRSDYRSVTKETYLKAGTDVPLSEALERIDAMDGPERIEADFDRPARYAEFKEELVRNQEASGEMLWMPPQWSAGPRVTWFGADWLGYENFFIIIAQHESHAQKLLEIGGASARCQSLLIARAVREGIFPRAVVLGEDICSQRGPMVSPKFLEKHYLPALKHAFEPLEEVGCRVVWHSDGDVRPMLDLLIESGVKGFQGFQSECGMTIELMASKRTREGEKLLIFGPLSVTTELPRLTPAGIAERVRNAIDVCRGQASLCLFTANEICPDTPLENIIAAYETAKTYVPW